MHGAIALHPPLVMMALVAAGTLNCEERVHARSVHACREPQRQQQHAHLLRSKFEDSGERRFLGHVEPAKRLGQFIFGQTTLGLRTHSHSIGKLGIRGERYLEADLRLNLGHF